MLGVRIPTLDPASGPLRVRVAEIVTIAGASAAMYRLQQTGDAMVILEAAGAIVVLTVAGTVARVIDEMLCCAFGLESSGDATTEDEPDDAGQR